MITGNTDDAYSHLAAADKSDDTDTDEIAMRLIPMRYRGYRTDAITMLSIPMRN